MMERAGAIVDRALEGEDASDVYGAFARLAVECTRAGAAWIVLERDGQRFAGAYPNRSGPQPSFLRTAELETRLSRRPMVRTPAEGGVPFVTAPVRLGTEHLGCVVLALDESCADPEVEAQALVGLASLIAVAHRCRELHRERRRAHEETVRALTNALRARDPETAGESQRVTSLARELALELGYDPKADETHDLYHGALLHDIGKLGVPEAVLDKAEPLTEEEWGEMRRHPELAAEILEGIPFLDGAARLIHACRERWDGEGYPRGLAGQQIPPAARIFAVADAWEAMTSPRSYGPVLTPEEAHAEIAASAGTRFDPQVVEAFERLAPVWLSEAARRNAVA